MKNKKVKVMGPKINATEEIDISDFKLNNRFYGTHRDEVVFDKNTPQLMLFCIKMRNLFRKKENFLKSYRLLNILN